jgi:ArsR family transcriptional regulator, arsenate/arsenite/antimonite-responsive transcriptional repressor
MPIAPNRAREVRAEKLFRALADRTRLRLLNLMSGQEICVCYLVEVLGLSQPKISRHLAYLRRAGIVSARRQGRWMHYRISDGENPLLARLWEHLKPIFIADDQMQRDTLRLKQASCAPQRLVALRRAPLPTPLGSRAQRRGMSRTRG